MIEIMREFFHPNISESEFTCFILVQTDIKIMEIERDSASPNLLPLLKCDF